MSALTHDWHYSKRQTCHSIRNSPNLELAWSLSLAALEDVALLRQPCVNAAHLQSTPEASNWGGNFRSVKTWGSGVIAVQRPTRLENLSGKNDSGCSRQRLAVAHCGTPVVLPCACRALPWHEDLPTYFVTVWDSSSRLHPQQQENKFQSCFTRDEALEALIACVKGALTKASEEEVACTFGSGDEEVPRVNQLSREVQFELLVETLILVAATDGHLSNQAMGRNLETGHHRVAQLHRAANEIPPGRVCHIEEVVFGGSISGIIEIDQNGIILGTQISISNASLTIDDGWLEMVDTVGSQDLEDQISALIDKLMRSPGLWSMLHASPSLPGTKPGSSLGVAFANDSDIFVQSRLKIIAPETGQMEDISGEVAKTLRKLAGLEENCQQLQVDFFDVKSLQTPLPKSPSRSHRSNSPGSPRRSPLGLSSREDAFSGIASSNLTATRQFSSTMPAGIQTLQLSSQTPSSYCLVELNVMLYRWGFWLQVGDATDYAADSQILHLEPGTMVDVRLELPSESLRLPWRPHQFLVTLVPSISAPWNLKSLMEAALLVERLPGDIARKNSPSLDIQVAVPESLECPVPPIGLEMRVYAVEFGSLEDRNGGCVALGKPLKCRIGNSPGPLQLLTTLSTSLVQWKLMSNGTLRHICKGEASNFWGDVQNMFFEPHAIVFCHSADEFALRNALAQHAAYVTDAARESGHMPRCPEPIEIHNKDVGSSEGPLNSLCVVSSGVPILSIKTEKGIHSYRIECTRKVPLGSGSRQSAVPRSFVFLTTQVPVGTPENATLQLKISNLLPGRYTFRAQARCWNSTTFGPFSVLPSMDCLLPDHAEQLQRLHEVSEIISEGREVNNVEKLKSAIQAALETGVERDNRILLEADKLLQNLQADLHGQSLRRWQRAEDALNKVRVQLRLQYRPTLEKALQEAVDAGVDEKLPDMTAAYSLFYDLQHTETVHRKQAQARSQKATNAKKMLRRAAKPPRVRSAIEQALKFAESAGVPPESEAVREAKTALRAALVSEDIAYRRQFRRRVEEHRSTQDEERKNSARANAQQKDSPHNFLRRGSALSRQKMGPLDQLFDAAQRGQVDRIKKLLVSRAELIETGANGMTALSFAAQNAHVEAVVFLLNSRASADQVDDTGGTALMHCATHEEGHRVINALADARADVNLRNAYGKTALHIAAGGHQFRVVRALVGQRADPDAQDIDGETPITAATTAASSVARSLVLECLEGARRG